MLISINFPFIILLRKAEILSVNNITTTICEGENTSLIVVTKNQDLDSINLLVKANHINFGENRVQEALLKWKNLILFKLIFELFH